MSKKIAPIIEGRIHATESTSSIHNLTNEIKSMSSNMAKISSQRQAMLTDLNSEAKEAVTGLGLGLGGPE